MQTLHVIRNYITTSHYYDHALGSKVQTRKPGHLEENCPITTFSLNKRSRFSIFFSNRPINSSIPLMYVTVENFKTI